MLKTFNELNYDYNKPNWDAWIYINHPKNSIKPYLNIIHTGMSRLQDILRVVLLNKMFKRIDSRTWVGPGVSVIPISRVTSTKPVRLHFAWKKSVFVRFSVSRSGLLPRADAKWWLNVEGAESRYFLVWGASGWRNCVAEKRNWHVDHHQYFRNQEQAEIRPAAL